MKAKLRIGQQHPWHRTGTALQKTRNYLMCRIEPLLKLGPLKPGLFGEMTNSRSKARRIQDEPKTPYWAREQGNI